MSSSSSSSAAAAWLIAAAELIFVEIVGCPAAQAINLLLRGLGAEQQNSAVGVGR